MEEALKWCVLFETKEKTIHPIYLQNPNGNKISLESAQKYAADYLLKQDWLVKVYDIYSKDKEDVVG